MGGGQPLLDKKAFTLIELLAVIVILAIIALIAVPIILNIVNDARESAKKRSVELYGKAIENAIAKSELKGEPVAAGDLSNTFLSSVQYNGEEVSCTTNKLYADGSIYLSGCSVGGVAVDYTYGTEQGGSSTSGFTVTAATASTKTTGNVPAGNYAAGDEYIINIGGQNRIFFVLGENESDTSKVDLIMNQNIGNTVAWCLSGSDNSCAADGALAELSRVTSDWEVTPTLPTRAQIKGAYTGTMPEWLYDYLDSTTHSVSDLYGYWTSSPNSDYSDSAWHGYYIGSVDYDSVFVDDSYGVRPVITISKSLLD